MMRPLPGPGSCHKVELHLHTSRYSACAIESPEQTLRLCDQAGYDVVYLTEHDRVWPDEQRAALQRAFPQMRIFPGVELTVDWSPLQHLVVLGTSDPEYLEIADRPREVIAKARREGHLTILAHPLRFADDVPLLQGRPRPDAMEYHTCNQSDVSIARKVAALASRYGVKLVNAGDVHAADFVDRFWIETQRPVESPDDIRRIVLEGAYERRAVGEQ